MGLRPYCRNVAQTLNRMAVIAGLMLAALLALASGASASSCGGTNRILDTPVHISDGSLASTTNRIWIPAGGTTVPKLEDVDVNVDITHPSDADLDISITHNGVTVNLSSDNGGNGQNYTRTVFDDSAATSITAGSAPFTNSYKPESPLSAFNDMDPQGIWTLNVRDDTGTLSGGGGGGPAPPQQINSWGLRYSENACPAFYTPCDQVVGGVGVPLSTSTSGSRQVTGNGSVTRVDVGFTITHPDLSEVHLSLKVGNTTVHLLNQGAVSGANLTRTVFSDAAATAITSGSAPYSGSFRPQEALSAFNGRPVSTSWTIEAGDAAGGSSGNWVEETLRVLADTCVDPDDDAVWSALDNCPDAANSGQANHDRFGDALGDACDPDDDNDGVADASDACPLGEFDAGQPTPADTDGDGCNDANEDTDDDNDGLADTADGCPLQAPAPGTDIDGDGCSADLDSDDDGDGVADASDACPAGVVGPGDDADGNGCKGSEDPDGDGVPESRDRCPLGTPGPGGDADGDGCKDATEDLDDDADGVTDAADNCPATANASRRTATATARATPATSTTTTTGSSTPATAATSSAPARSAAARSSRARPPSSSPRRRSCPAR